MPGIWYRTGTVDVTNGSKDVIGSGTLWLDPKVGAQPGNMIFMPDGEPYEVAYVITDTKIILATVYGGSSATAQPYAIVTPLVGSIPALASKVASTLAFAQGQYETLDAWAHGGDDEDVTLTNPNNGETTVVPSLAKLSKTTEKVGDALPAAIRAEAAEQLALQHKNAAAGSAQQAAGRAASVGADADRASAAALSAESSKTAVDAAAAQVASDKNAAAQSASTATTKAAEAVATEQRVLSAAESQISAVTAEGVAQVLRVEGTGDIQVARVTTQGNTQDSRVVDQGNTQVSLVAAEGDTQVSLVAAEGDTQVSLVAAEGSTQVSLVAAEGSTQVSLVAAEGSTQASLVAAEGNTQVSLVAAEGNMQVAAATAQAQASEASAVRSEAAAVRAEDLVEHATGGALLKEQNLADVPNKEAARTNLSVMSSAQVSDAISAATKNAVDKTKNLADIPSKPDARANLDVPSNDQLTRSIAASSVPFPDVWIPFNDSLRMLAGYGDDIKVGDYTVATQASFSRASTATYIDKSGVLRTAAINEPRFEKEGLLIEGQSTNRVTKSEDLSTWWKNGDSTREKLAGIYTKITTTGGTMGCYLADTTLVVGKTYTISFWAYAETLTSVCIGVEKESSATVNTITQTPTRYTKTFTATQTNGTIIAYSATDTSGAFVVGGFQLEELPFASSYIPTNGAAATRAADCAWIQSSDNIGRVATVSVIAHPLNHANMPRAFVFGAGGFGGVEAYGSKYLFTGAGRSSTYVAIGPEATARVFARRATAVTFGAANRSAVTSTEPGGADWGDFIHIGGVLTASAYKMPFWGHLRDFKVWMEPRNLTDDQLKAIA